MRLLSILLLCSHCLLGSAIVIDDDCNDENVFNAVDEALKSFNNAKEDGNQFILYRITDAKIKNEEDGEIYHFIEYEIQEGSCDVKSGKSWQECSPTYAHRAKCSAHVRFNKKLKIRSVESQNCSSPKVIDEPPVKDVNHQCLGCSQPIDKENKELLCFVHSAIEQVNRDANHPFYFDLESVANATRQVVFGWKYNIQFLIQQTNCSKVEFESKDFKECKIDKGGEFFKCTAWVAVTPDGTVSGLSVQCKSDIESCLNCPIVLNSEDPELRTLLVQVMDEYNVNSNHTELYDVDIVVRAIKTGFQRHLYDVQFMIGPTNCSKPEYSILGPGCVLNETQIFARLSCETKITVTDKTVNVHSAPQCWKPMYSKTLRISGMSPLRSRRGVKRDVNNRNGHKHGIKGKKDKEEKNKHEHQHQDSSEEDNESEVTQAPLLLTKPAIQKPGNLPADQSTPEVCKNQEMSTNRDKTYVSIFVELPTDIVPRCPGRMWQPISLIPTVKAFSDDDLLHAVDSTLPSGPNIEEGEPFTPKQMTAGFSDDDLLGLI